MCGYVKVDNFFKLGICQATTSKMSGNTAKKPKISQEELRKMMNREKLKQYKTAKEIDSPLARYSKDGSVICIICNTPINREVSWGDHISSKSHRDKILMAKEKRLLTIDLRPGKEIGDLKRPSEPSFKEPVPAKKPKGILKNAPPLPPSRVIFESSEKKTKVSKKTTGSALVQYNSEEDDSDEETPHSAASNTAAGNTPADSTPADNKPTPSASSSSSAAYHRGETVPEGFFDDPIMDAKARNIEYRDPQEEEWEKFMKEMKEESSTSAQIIAEDQEEATVERTIEEMDEQLRRWGRVMELVKKKEEVQTIERNAMEEDDEEMREDPEDFDEFLDWRAKKSYR